jgi:two-component system, sensor histidine kinase
MNDSISRNSATAKPLDDPRVRTEVVALLYRNATVGITMNLLAMPLVWLAYRNVLPTWPLVSAIALWVLLQAVSAWNRAQWMRLKANEQAAAHTSARFLERARRMAWALAIGMSILLAVLHFAAPPATPALAATIALIYVLGASISTLVYLPQIKTFSTIVLGSQAALLLLRQSPIEALVALLLIALIVGLWGYGRRYSEQFQQTIVLRFEVQDLLAEQARLRGIAEAAHEAKSRFFAAASHDVRQPLQALMLNFHALRHAQTDERRARVLNASESSLSALRQLFDQVLELSKIDAGALHVKPQAVPLETLFDKLDARFSSEAAAKKVWLRFAPTTATITSDPDALERMLANLIGNAIKHTERGGVWIGYRSARGRIEVRDSGIGIPAEHHARLFDEFYQVENVARDRAMGLGLGLSIVQRIGALLSHDAGFTSAPNRGSTFWITTKAPEGAVEHFNTKAPLRESPVGSLRDTSLWIIDNDIDVAAALAGIVRSAGAQVSAFNSPDAAISQARIDSNASTPPPDVIICDYRFGAAIDGVATIKTLREIFKRDVPAILLTGDTSIKDLSHIDGEIHSSNATTRLIHKPVAAHDLIDAVITLHTIER